MTWNWEQPGWPTFSYAAEALEPLERQFLVQSGEFVGAFKHIGADDRETFKIELIGEEALKTSEIEGEILNRDSVQSSLRYQFGLADQPAKVPAAERGVSEMMADLYRNFAEPIDDATLFAWHRMLLSGDQKVSAVGGYRAHQAPMQVVSGPDYKRRIHFEAPPSNRVPVDMTRFNHWFNNSAPGGKHRLPALTRAGIAHLHFVSIHPFEDGNGRIGRAVAEKALAQSLGQPSLIALSYTIERERRDYYAALENNNKTMEITAWLAYFAETVLRAQRHTIDRVDFFVAKARFYDRLRDKLNMRQDKVLARMFRAGIDGFKGGLSAENYISITQASRATASRDLQDLVEKGALTRTGTLRHTRYRLAVGG